MPFGKNSWQELRRHDRIHNNLIKKARASIDNKPPTSFQLSHGKGHLRRNRKKEQVESHHHVQSQ